MEIICFEMTRTWICNKQRTDISLYRFIVFNKIEENIMNEHGIRTKHPRINVINIYLFRFIHHVLYFVLNHNERMNE